MTTTPHGIKRITAAAVLAGAGALAGLVLTPATAHAEPGRATGPSTWCPGQYQSFAGGGSGRPNWDWNVCHTYWWVYGEPGGNVADSVWEGALPPRSDPPGEPVASAVQLRPVLLPGSRRPLHRRPAHSGTLSARPFLLHSPAR